MLFYDFVLQALLIVRTFVPAFSLGASSPVSGSRPQHHVGPITCAWYAQLLSGIQSATRWLPADLTFLESSTSAQEPCMLHCSTLETFKSQ